MNHLVSSWTAWTTARVPDAAVWSFVQHGLGLLLQTTLLLTAGLWMLQLLRKRGSRLSGFVARALLVAVLVSIAGGALNARLAPAGEGQARSLWKVALPRDAAAAPQFASLPLPRAATGNPLAAGALEPPVQPVGTGARISSAALPGPASPLAPSLRAAQNDEAAMATAPGRRAALASLAAAVWLAGSAALLVWLAACHAALALLRRGAQPVSDSAVAAALAQVCAALEVRAPRLLQHPRVSGPFLAGLSRPAIMLPTGDALQGEALRAVLLHEAAHLKRRDLWWNAAGRIGCALLWPQPLLWMLCRRLEEINEEECDEAVLFAGCERGQYARCLLEWAESLTARRAERVAGAGVLTGRSTLSRRVQLILNNAHPRGRRITARLRWAAVLGIMGAVVAMPLTVSIEAAPQASEGPPQVAAMAPPEAKTNKRPALVRFVVTKEFTASIGGVSRDTLHYVSIAQKRPNGTISRTISARFAQPRAGTGSSPKHMWWFGDANFQQYDEQKGMIADSRHMVGVVLDIGSVASFLTRQLGARREGATAAQRRDFLRFAAPPLAQLKAVRQWAKDRGRATVAGRVVDDEGKPVAGTEVSIAMDWQARSRIAKSESADIFIHLQAFSSREKQLFFQRAATDSKGRYSFSGLAGGVDFDVRVDQYTRIANRIDNPVTPYVPLSSSVIVPREGQAITAPDLNVTRGGRVRVRVQDIATGAPLPGIAVLGAGPSRSSGMPWYRVDSDAAGESLFRLPAGAAAISIQDPVAVRDRTALVLSNGVPYLYLSGAQVTIDGAPQKAGLNKLRLQLAKGQTRQVLVRLKRYVPPAPLVARHRLVQYDLTPARQVFVGGVVDGVLQCVTIENYRGIRITRIIAARTARRQDNSARWVLKDVVITDLGPKVDPGQVAEATAQTLTMVFPEADAFLLKQTKAKNQPAPPGLWASLRKKQTDGIRNRDAMRRLARGRGHATVTGRVIDDEGRPVPNARVSIQLSRNSMRKVMGGNRSIQYDYLRTLPSYVRGLFFQNAVADGDGNYRVPGLAGGYEYELSLQPYALFGSNKAVPLTSTVTLAGAKVVPRENATTAVPAIETTAGGLVTVRTEDKATGAPVPGVTVWGRVTRARTPGQEAFLVTTNAAGEAVFRLPAGDANISLFSMKSQQDQPAMTVLANGIRYSLRGNLDMTLDGAVARPRTNALDLQIEKGHTRRLIVRLPHYAASQPTPAPAPAPAPSTARFSLPPGKAILTGRVVDDAGRPVAGVPVVAQMQRSAEWVLIQRAGLGNSPGDQPDQLRRWQVINRVGGTFATTRADGSFRLDGLTTAPYNLMVSSMARRGSTAGFGMQPPSGGVAPAVEGAWAHEGAVTRRAQPIVVSSGALIVGRVVDKATGQPLGGVTLASNGPQMPGSVDNVFATTSDARGRFTFRVAPGTTSLYIAGPNSHALDRHLVFADDRTPAKGYRVGTSRGLYAGSDHVLYQLDGATPQYGLDFGPRDLERIQIPIRAGQTRTLTLRLRRLVKA